MIRHLLTAVASLAIVVGVWGLPSTGAGWWSDGAAPGDPDGAPRELGWEDLVQPGFEPPPDPFMTITTEELDKLFDGSEESRRQLAEYERLLRIAPINEALDGQLVTLPGYVVPLDFDAQTRFEEFLLVPYFGACIHTPPPPANQIVLAELDSPVEIEDTYLPVRLRGVLRADTATTPLAETGYRMDVVAVEPYVP